MTVHWIIADNKRYNKDLENICLEDSKKDDLEYIGITTNVTVFQGFSNPFQALLTHNKTRSI